MSVVWAFIVWVRRLSGGGLGRLFKDLVCKRRVERWEQRVSRDSCGRREDREGNAWEELRPARWESSRLGAEGRSSHEDWERQQGGSALCPGANC